MSHATTSMILGILLAGCSEWPRHAHLPSGDKGAISTDDDPADAIEIDWNSLGEESEPNDHPGRLHSLAMGEGLSLEGTLNGIGWDANAEPAQWSECGDPLAFPPADSGDYTGDVEWLAVESKDAATLCTTVLLDDKEVSFDLSLYVLDECGEPVEIYVNGNKPVGVERTGGRWSGSVVIPAGAQIGIALSSYWPDDPHATIAWRLAASLVPPLTHVDLCPEMP